MCIWQVSQLSSQWLASSASCATSSTTMRLPPKRPTARLKPTLANTRCAFVLVRNVGWNRTNAQAWFYSAVLVAAQGHLMKASLFNENFIKMFRAGLQSKTVMVFTLGLFGYSHDFLTWFVDWKHYRALPENITWFIERKCNDAQTCSVDSNCNGIKNLVYRVRTWCCSHLVVKTVFRSVEWKCLCLG